MSDVLLSRYKIIQKLGSGGFGDTYLAQDTALPSHPFCIVKQLKPKDPDPAILPIAKILFEREAESLYRLGKHDQIPSIYAYFQENREFYIVQEFIDGEELSQELIPGKHWDEQQTVKLLQKILEVLEVVHQQNIIHRDIKPSNIMRRKRDGKLILIDFGAVKELSSLTVTSQGQTSLTVGIGTPGYMPSEQSQGKPKPASDIYAVGMLGIQALTGVPPNQLPENPQTGEIIWRDHIQVSDKLAVILDKMVHEFHRSRYQNASEALQALTFLKSSVSSPLLPTEVSSPDSTQPKSNSTKLLPWAILGGLAVAGIIGGISVINKPSPVETTKTQPSITPSVTPSLLNPSPQASSSPSLPSVVTPASSSSSSLVWRSQSGKTKIPDLDSICRGNRRLNSVQTVFASPPYRGSLVFNTPKTGGCVPGDSLWGDFKLYQNENDSYCRGTITVTWLSNNNAHIEWDITNRGSAPNCSASTNHWEIDTYPITY